MVRESHRARRGAAKKLSEGGGGDTDSPPSWAAVFVNLSREYHFTPAEISAMTLAQLYHYTRPDEADKPQPKSAECYEWESKFMAQADRNERAKRKEERRRRRRKKKGR